MEAVEVYKRVGVVAYLVILLGIGMVASRRMADVGDDYAAGKKLGFWSVAFSARATGESGWLWGIAVSRVLPTRRVRSA